MKTTEVIDGLYTKNEEVDNGLFPIVKWRRISELDRWYKNFEKCHKERWGPIKCLLINYVNTQ